MSQRFGPCCFAISLKRGAQIISIFELIKSSFMAIALISVLATLGSLKNSKEDQHNKNTTSVEGQSKGQSNPATATDILKAEELEVLLVFGLMFFIVEIILAAVLYRGAVHEKVKHLNVWWWIRLSLMLLFLLIDVIAIFTGQNKKFEFAICVEVLYEAYVLWLVKALMDEIRGIGPLRFTQLNNPVTIVNQPNTRSTINMEI